MGLTTLKTMFLFTINTCRLREDTCNVPNQKSINSWHKRILKSTRKLQETQKQKGQEIEIVTAEIKPGSQQMFEVMLRLISNQRKQSEKVLSDWQKNYKLFSKC